MLEEQEFQRRHFHLSLTTKQVSPQVSTLLSLEHRRQSYSGGIEGEFFPSWLEVLWGILFVFCVCVCMFIMLIPLPNADLTNKSRSDHWLKNITNIKDLEIIYNPTPFSHSWRSKTQKSTKWSVHVQAIELVPINVRISKNTIKLVVLWSLEGLG